MKLLNTFVVVALVMVLFTSCVRYLVGQRQVKLCNDLATINNAILTLRAANATVRDMKQAMAQTGKALKTLQSFSRRDGPEADIQAIEAAYQDLGEVINQIPAQSTVSQITTVIENKVTTLDTAVTRTKSRLRCP